MGQHYCDGHYHCYRGVPGDAQILVRLKLIQSNHFEKPLCLLGYDELHLDVVAL